MAVTVGNLVCSGQIKQIISQLTNEPIKVYKLSFNFAFGQTPKKRSVNKLAIKCKAAVLAVENSCNGSFSYKTNVRNLRSAGWEINAR